MFAWEVVAEVLLDDEIDVHDHVVHLNEERAFLKTNIYLNLKGKEKNTRKLTFPLVVRLVHEAKKEEPYVENHQEMKKA